MGNLIYLSVLGQKQMIINSKRFSLGEVFGLIDCEKTGETEIELKDEDFGDEAADSLEVDFEEEEPE